MRFAKTRRELRSIGLRSLASACRVPAAVASAWRVGSNGHVIRRCLGVSAYRAAGLGFVRLIKQQKLCECSNQQQIAMLIQ
jgi:hypothetical protein